MNMQDINFTADHQGVIQLAKALSNPIRVRMIIYLASAKLAMPKSFERALDISQPQVSKHLKVLRSAGIFSVERISSVNVYRLDLERNGAIHKVINY